MPIAAIGVVRRRAAELPGACRVLTAAGLLVPAVVFGGCTANHHSEPSASDVVASSGAVPIPSAEPAVPTPTATAGHPALLAIGGAVRVTFPDGQTGVVTALGPAQESTAPRTAAGGGRASTRAVITLRVAMTRGTATVSAAELSSRDETGRLIPLARRGPEQIHATTGPPQQLQVAGVFDSGAAQITWRHERTVLAVWTFNIELD